MGKGASRRRFSSEIPSFPFFLFPTAPGISLSSLPLSFLSLFKIKQAGPLGTDNSDIRDVNIQSTLVLLVAALPSICGTSRQTPAASLKMFALLASTQLLETDLFGPAGLNFMKMQVST